MMEMMIMFDVFNNKNFGSVRTVKNGNDIWFVGKDVVEALGYTLNNKHSAFEYIGKYCDDDDYILINKNCPSLQGGVDKTAPYSTLKLNYKELGKTECLAYNMI